VPQHIDYRAIFASYKVNMTMTSAFLLALDRSNACESEGLHARLPAPRTTKQDHWNVATFKACNQRRDWHLGVDMIEPTPDRMASDLD
jgi:hypothetical protein